ncbi:aldo/keto reductase [Gymnodinialimonas sp. 57CJ19]|uniref:aldo/keto reductase n=1 Tax=Gymnodinialimonas sp. 57CJ19 TaxID=3138498 RepID=UPI0031342D74
METRLLGKSGLRVSAIGLGCNNFGGMIDGLDLDGARAVIEAALDADITFFDTADSYGTDGGSETVLGEVLGPRRKDIVLATKFASPMGGRARGDYDGSRRYIMGAVEDSLTRLKTDYIDLYQYHFPDPNTPIEETLRALEDTISQGKVRYIGCSNLPAWQLVDASWTARSFGGAAFLSTQAEYNILSRDVEADLLPALQSTGMALLPYFPLASGLLTGKYRKGAQPDAGRLVDLAYFKGGLTEARLTQVEALIAFAQTRGRSLLELAFAWLLAQPQVASVMAGATRAEQVRANAAAVEWRLTADDLVEVDRCLGMVD